MWIAALIPLAYHTVNEMTAVLKEYFEYSVAVTFEYDTNSTLEFPDVTICNMNPLRRSKLCSLTAGERDMDRAMDARLCGIQEGFKDVRILCRLLYMTSCVNGCTFLLQANMEDFQLQQNLSFWLSKKAGKHAQMLRSFGHQFNDTIVDCTYADQNCTDERYFHSTFNVDFGNCFCFHCQKNEKELAKFFRYGSLSSPHNGLVITLHAEMNEYLPTSFEAGFLAMIHAHDTLASECSDGVYVTPGYTTYVGLNMMAQTGLPYPYASACRKTWPRQLRPYLKNPAAVYTREECLNMCLQLSVIKHCKCQAQSLPVLQGIHNGSQMHAEANSTCIGEAALQCAGKKYTSQTSIFLENECRCSRPCTDIHYNRDVTMAEFSLRRDHVRKKRIKGPLTRLVVYFKTLTYENIRSVPKYDGTRVLSNVGGINGMYIGLSFYILFQVVDILIMGALKLRERRRKQEVPHEPRQGTLATAGHAELGCRMARTTWPHAATETRNFRSVVPPLVFSIPTINASLRDRYDSNTYANQSYFRYRRLPAR
ncbi:acid-sensing ion channel 2-like [Ornithodoros turicata]|uniref:acid-sensing ion channel 2-like n=1 Tax=Ornithodoros turicata TaxID=34597 RepID=UPI0031392950